MRKLFRFDAEVKGICRYVCQQDPQHQGEARQEAAADPTDPSVDPDEDRKHHPLQLRAPPLVEDQAQALNPARPEAMPNRVSCSSLEIS